MMHFTKRSLSRDVALSRVDGEGGAVGAPLEPARDCREIESPMLGNSELVQLRIRMIAMESLLVTLLSKASDLELDLARDMATYISPRPGFTRHPMTLNAAALMLHLVGRASRIRAIALS